jgi:hypothetical protein
LVRRGARLGIARPLASARPPRLTVLGSRGEPTRTDAGVIARLGTLSIMPQDQTRRSRRSARTTRWLDIERVRDGHGRNLVSIGDRPLDISTRVLAHPVSMPEPSSRSLVLGNAFQDQPHQSSLRPTITRHAILLPVIRPTAVRIILVKPLASATP